MSWYFNILPFYEQNTIFTATNFSLIISSPDNMTARSLKINTLACPSTGMQTDEAGVACWSRVRANYAVNFGNTSFGQTNTYVDPFTNTVIAFGGAPRSPWARSSASATSPTARATR